jgi:hypothetical protein
LRNSLKSKIADISTYTAGVLRLESTAPGRAASGFEVLVEDAQRINEVMECRNWNGDDSELINSGGNQFFFDVWF